MENVQHSLHLYQEENHLHWEKANLNAYQQYRWNREDHGDGYTTVHIFINEQQLSKKVETNESRIQGAISNLLDQAEAQTRPSKEMRKEASALLAASA